MIFLVDDDPIQNLITSQLISSNFGNIEYEIFNNGTDLLKALEDGASPKLILLDINMPIMGGWEFLDKYQKFKNQKAVIMLTSSINDEDLNRSKKYDFVIGYYTKPVSMETIRKILDQNIKYQ